MRTRHHTVSAVAGAVLATTLLVACGGDGDDDTDDVASLGTDDATTETSVASDEPSKDPEEAMLEFTECMRDHGVDMPDPQIAGDGGERMITMEGNAMDTENFEEAQEACEPLMAAAVGEIERDPEREAEMREQMLEYAQCMRDHGIDMPDPTFNDNGGVQIGVGGDGAEIDDDEFVAANEACADDGMFMAAPSRVGED
jgi:hypothetical protein